MAVTNMLEDQTTSFSVPEIIIGRSPASSYIIHNETVSSAHARLAYHHEQWWVEDLRSTNGSFLNEERISTPTVIMNGDELRCGQVNIHIQIDDATSHI
jgi:pSer/pThr/pTyr-binding forkhead associated (FHA) protein